ncbi:discoidin domain-containing protein [Streptomyces sp. NPDC002055]|uniref:discoidin domain-containing protein n=1 Tax=Streptomyces sp. NPDC002055 TaxID=3154534 RepID=UPI00332BE6F3
MQPPGRDDRATGRRRFVRPTVLLVTCGLLGAVQPVSAAVTDRPAPPRNGARSCAAGPGSAAGGAARTGAGGGSPTGSASRAESAGATAAAGQEPGWSLTSSRYDPRRKHHAYVGNGYLGQSLPPAGTGYAGAGEKTGWPLFTPRYDGAFVAGLYAHNKKTAENRQAVAALPTWSGMTVSAGGDTFNSSTPADRISHYRQTVFLRCGLVRTSLTWTTRDGRAMDLVQDVVADRRNAHVGAVRLRVTPHWKGDATVTDVLDGRGARRMSATGSPVGGGRDGRGPIGVGFRTDGTRVDGALVSTLRPGPGVRVRDRARTGKGLTARQSLDVRFHAGRSYEFTKYVGVDTELTSRAPGKDAARASHRAAGRGWRQLLAAHSAAWRALWRSDIEVPRRPRLQRWLRASQYGLLSSVRRGSPNSIGPTGLTSDNYAGLKFWDAETWMFPSLLASHPKLAESVLEYRYRTMPGARANARKLGQQGLFYAWTSGSKGDLASECHSVDPPHCRTQIHLQSDIALAVWQYYQQTGDRDWLRTRGWPMLKGIADFWAGRASRNGDGSYSLKNVAGPDEYSNGVDDGVFTNAGAATALRNAGKAARLLGRSAPRDWSAVADGLRIPYDKDRKIFRQYAGYRGSKIKQADTVLLMYPLEWPMPQGAASRTLDYYAAHTDPDGPAMTDSVHAIDAAAIGEPGCSVHTYLKRSIKPFVRGPFSLFSEARGEKAGAEDPLAGSPAQDFLTGKGGFLQTFTGGLAGLRWRADRVHLDPTLPPQLSDGVTLRGLRWQGRTYDVAIGPEHTTVRLTRGEPFTVETRQGSQVVSAGAPAVLKTRRPDLTPTDNLARCRTAKAGSEEPGQYANAAVDGNAATAWVANGARGELTTDLGRPARVSRISADWAGRAPASHRVLTSLDGRHWRPVAFADGKPGDLAKPTPARYARIEVRGASPKQHPGIREFRVTRAPEGERNR